MEIQALRPEPGVPPLRGPLVLAILDGVGVGPADDGDAVHLAPTPTLDALRRSPRWRTLRAHGRAVGLPSDDDMGNSEVGHNALGAGRVVRQGAALVQDALANGALAASATLDWLVEPLLAPGRAARAPTLHLCGLLSDGNVHAHIEHVEALLRLAAARGVRRLRVHALADGRDVDDPSFERFLGRLDQTLDQLRAGGVDAALASGGGRMVVTMDRYEADWAVVARGWAAHVDGEAPAFASWRHALAALRLAPAGASDQTLGPFVIADDAGPIGRVEDGDSFVLWNFRGDRAVELCRAFEEGDAFPGFVRRRRPRVRFAGMTQYDGDLKLPARFLVAPPIIRGTLSERLLASGVDQLAVSETQKFGHVTYFWNGNRSEPLDAARERWVEIPSDRVPFERAPAMQAGAITDVVVAALQEPCPPRFIRLNWANGDMVGHSGDLAATVQAMAVVDAQLARLRAAVRAAGGALVVCADHGNADDMWQRDKAGRPLLGPAGAPRPKTSHTLAPVPFAVDDPRPGWRLRDDLPEAGLANVAATLCLLLGLQPPAEFAPALLRYAP
jgi:2,3-bisphosphoglycerate-independent phosphoglycerate mutase